MNENLPPSPAEVEELAKEMIHLKVEVSRIKANAEKEAEPHEKRAEELKATAIAWLKTFGSKHEEKSRLLHGVLYEVMGTFGSQTTIDYAAAEVFRLGLKRAGQTRLMKRVFEAVTSYSLKEGCGDIIRGAKLRPKLLALFSQCTVVKDRTPVVTPRLKKKETEAA